ncbi:hypothetical protein GCM10010211_22590 [Streptomyces albospinus]|uniref:Uncharacterized protein n=1 Tax=Streptomyces albospinus TaxID=285515 RepID=A0ABQ2UY19_9ACTN|nr:hypothetical protein GCM10010211_22590 [Streptomyces albospinus]
MHAGRRHGGRHPVQAARTGGEQQHPAHRVVDLRLGDLAGADGRRERGAEDRAGPRHRHVQAAAQRAYGVPGRHPVGDVAAVEAPFAAQDLGDERAVFGHRQTIDLVVGGHDAPGAGGLDDVLEGGEIELAQGAWGDAVVDREAVGLGVVADEVLDRRTDPALLHSLHISGADHAGQQRVFRIALEVPAAERRAVQVDGRRQEDVDALAAGLLGEQSAGAAGEFGVPGGGQGRGAGQGDRRIFGAPLPPPHADRAVRHHQRPQSDRRHGGQGPHVLAGEQPGLGIQVECGERPLHRGGVVVGPGVAAVGVGLIGHLRRSLDWTCGPPGRILTSAPCTQ